MFLEKEDYAESGCRSCSNQNGKMIPLDRVICKMDEYLDRKDYPGAIGHLEYWLREADDIGDVRGAFSLHNELMGCYRKTGDRDNAIKNAEAAMLLMEEAGAQGASAGTCYVNSATVFCAFGEKQRSLSLFEKAQEEYGKANNVSGFMRASLFNNMALVLVDLKRFGEAYRCYQRAMEALGENGGELERAITLLNMADAAEAEHGAEKAEKKIEMYLEDASKLLDSESVSRDGYYAFVCEKCAPVYDYHGWFMYASELQERANGIYERA